MNQLLAPMCRRLAKHRKEGDIVMPPSVLRVLVAVLAIAQAGRPITIRAIAKRLGFRSHFACFGPLNMLRAEGLVDWENKGSGRRRNATIRPLCRMELWEWKPCGAAVEAEYWGHGLPEDYDGGRICPECAEKTEAKP